VIDRRGFVYFAESLWEEGYLVKIGYSWNPFRRINELCKIRTTSLLTYAPGGYADEAAIHDLFKANRREGEWFKVGRRLCCLMNYCVENGKLPPEILDAGEKMAALQRAKRMFAETNKVAGMAFDDDSGRWGDTPFKAGFKGPDVYDSSWLPRGYSNVTQEIQSRIPWESFSGGHRVVSA